MQESDLPVCFYSSANTPQGYLTCFENLYNTEKGWKAYMLIGCPGTSGSTILQNAGEALRQAGILPEYIYSPIDSSVLNAVSFPEKRVCLIDATPPNDFLPSYPGLKESVINLGEAVDESEIAEQRDNILLFSSRVSSSTERAFRFLAAAASLLSDTYRLVLDCTDISKLENYASHLAHRLFPGKNRQGTEMHRYLTAITPDGLKSFLPNISETYRNVIEIRDEYGIGKLFLSKLRSEALSAGYDVISCCCPMFPDGKPEHLLIPSLSTAYVTSGFFHHYEGSCSRHIHIRRFIDAESLRLKRPRISFNRKAARELLDESIVLLGDAQASRKMIKSIYDKATDPEIIEKKSKDLIQTVTGSPDI